MQTTNKQTADIITWQIISDIKSRYKIKSKYYTIAHIEKEIQISFSERNEKITRATNSECEHRMSI